ncbi:MAG: ATP-grasp domain-containing protein, partial [Myxococcales bacterium]
MKIHEFQAKEIFRKHGVPTPRGIVVHSPRDAERAARELGTKVVVVKSQIHAGGRGKGTFPDGGKGVRIAKSPKDARAFAETMIGQPLKTIQTGANGQVVRKLYIEEGVDIAKELYLGITLDRDTGRNTFMVSAEGGMDIEEVAAHSPEKIFRLAVDPATGFQPYQGRKLAEQLGLTGDTASKFAKFCGALHNVYVATDASLCEINPLVITGSGEVI